MCVCLRLSRWMVVQARAQVQITAVCHCRYPNATRPQAPLSLACLDLRSFKTPRARSFVSLFKGCAQEAMVGLVALDPGTIVAYGKTYCGRNCKGGCVPVMVCRQKLQSVWKVVLIDEFRTSKRSSCCGMDVLGPARQMLCPACPLTFERNTNTANNIANRLWQHAEDGSRTRGLERPVQAPGLPYMAEDKAPVR